jgi:hypothetical protein
MRNLLVSLSAASILFLIGCGEERHSMRVVPDRNGHAAADPTGKAGLGNKPTADEGEIWITTQPKDSLTSLAKKHGTTVEWLIKRNDLKDGLPAPGSNLIVPAPGAPAK